MSTKVAIVKCENYDYVNVKSALSLGIDLLGGLSHLIIKDSRVLLKPNLLAPLPPERAVTTHPNVVKAVAEYIKELKADVAIGDTPGVAFFKGRGNALDACGIKQVAEDVGAKAFQFEQTGYVFKKMPNGKQLKEVFIAKPIAEADFVINLPKLKTHAGTIMTGAIKNMFGIVAPKMRLQVHRLIKYNLVSEAIVDIFSSAVPDFTVMDAIVGMEGNGPTDGNPKEIGVLLMSFDSVALDTVAANLIGMDAANIYHIKDAGDRSLGESFLKKIDLLGEDILKVKVKFKLPVTSSISFLIPLLNLVESATQVYPQVDLNKCVKCGICRDKCPAGAIVLDCFPIIDKNKCIRCYCCSELCPERAMDLKRNWLARRRLRS